MSAKATNLALVEELVDLNDASVTQLQSLLPGIGNVLASRIVAYREEHGPFEQPTDITKVPGIGDRLYSKLAPRLSVAPGPTSGYSMRSESPLSMRSDTPLSMPAGIRSDASFPASMGGPISFSGMPDQEGSFPGMEKEESEFFHSRGALRSPGTPDLETLFLRGQVSENVAIEELESSGEPQSTEEVVSAPRATATPAPVQEVDMLAGEIIPLHRPWRAWMIGAGIALMSATVGSIYGIRSQEGGPQAGLERQVVRTQDYVADIKGSVTRLEAQSDTFATSINALDARLTDQERARGVQPKMPIPARPTAVETHPSTPSRTSEVRETVRQALRTFDEVRGGGPTADRANP